jgi:hypothetical protein
VGSGKRGRWATFVSVTTLGSRATCERVLSVENKWTKYSADQDPNVHSV